MWWCRPRAIASSPRTRRGRRAARGGRTATTTPNPTSRTTRRWPPPARFRSPAPRGRPAAGPPCAARDPPPRAPRGGVIHDDEVAQHRHGDAHFHAHQVALGDARYRRRRRVALVPALDLDTGVGRPHGAVLRHLAHGQVDRKSVV